MNTNFSLSIDNIKLDFTSMNTTGPKLFQVWTAVDGNYTRFHMQGNGIDTLTFTNPNDCPSFLLDLQEEIKDRVFHLYAAE